MSDVEILYLDDEAIEIIVSNKDIKVPDDELESFFETKQ